MSRILSRPRQSLMLAPGLHTVQNHITDLIESEVRTTSTVWDEFCATLTLFRVAAQIQKVDFNWIFPIQATVPVAKSLTIKRLQSGENYQILGKREGNDGKVEYLIAWEGVKSRCLRELKRQTVHEAAWLLKFVKLTFKLNDRIIVYDNMSRIRS